MCVAAATQVFHAGPHFPLRNEGLLREPTLCSSWAHCWGSAVRSLCSSWNDSPGSHSSLQACPGAKGNTLPLSLVTGHFGKAFPVEKTQRSAQGCDLLPQGLDGPGDGCLCFALVLMGHFPVFCVPCSLWVHIHHPQFGLLLVGWLGSANAVAWCLVLEILQQICFRT